VLTDRTGGRRAEAVLHTHKSPTASKWPGRPNLGAQSTIAAVERIANSFPVPWLLAPRTGDIFDNLEHCNRRLRAWAFVKGFDIVRNGGGTAANPSYRFRCIFHGIV
jgi:hypothetical protein